MSVFPTVKNRVAWARCAVPAMPKAVSRSNPLGFSVLVFILNQFWYKLQILYQIKKHPEFAGRYRRIKARREHKKAIIAILPYAPDRCLGTYPQIWNRIPRKAFLNHALWMSQNTDDFTGIYLLRLRGCTIKDDAVTITWLDAMSIFNYFGHLSNNLFTLQFTVF